MHHNALAFATLLPFIGKIRSQLARGVSMLGSDRHLSNAFNAVAM